MQLPKRKPGKYANGVHDPLVTQEKFDELSQKLSSLKKIQLGAAREVSRLAEFGDFSENVEYQLAKGRLRGINAKILELEYQLSHSEIIVTSGDGSRVEIGRVVTVKSEGKQKTFQILGSSETQPEEGIISHTSPLGSVLLGKKVGDVAEVLINGKKREYTIVHIG